MSTDKPYKIYLPGTNPDPSEKPGYKINVSLPKIAPCKVVESYRPVYKPETKSQEEIWAAERWRKREENRLLGLGYSEH